MILSAPPAVHLVGGEGRVVRFAEIQKQKVLESDRKKNREKVSDENIRKDAERYLQHYSKQKNT